jgi:tRNA (guanine-N7-)-methyltransferase
LKTETIHPASPAVIIPLPSIVERLDLAALFIDRQPLEIELGSGDGSFLAQYAGAHPKRNFIGVERLLGRLRKIERKSNRLGLANVRAVRIEAAYFLEYLLPPRTAEALHIYFPDPWPKRKHRKNRLINPRFTQLARTALLPGGKLYLRTDDADYVAQMKSVFAASPFFQEISTPPELADVLTDFERAFIKRGVQTQRLALQLIDT